MATSKTNDEYDVFKELDKLKVGQTIELETHHYGICSALIKRIYRVGTGLQFDLTISRQVTSFFNKKYVTTEDETYNYQAMALRLVVDKEQS